MTFPDPDQMQVLTTDASHLGLGAVLSQYPPGEPEKETVISYDSRILRGPETRYSAVHQEALAVCWAVHKYRHYLAGRHFILRTDNAAVSLVIMSQQYSTFQQPSNLGPCISTSFAPREFATSVLIARHDV